MSASIRATFIVMDSFDLESLFQSFDEKISIICAKFALLNTYIGEDKEKCVQLNDTLGSLNSMLTNMDQIINNQYQELQVSKQRCDGLQQLISDHLTYIADNYSKLLVKPEKPISKPNGTTTANASAKKKPIKHAEKMKPPSYTPKATHVIRKSNENLNEKQNLCKSVTKSAEVEPNPYPEIDPLDQNDFNSIPKYLLCRLTIEVLNESVQAFNTTIAKKYKFMNSSKMSSMKDQEMKRYQAYKAQENVETRGTYFCTINDIKELSSLKNDATLRKAMTCLRHCKRIKEIRGNPPKLIRFCIAN